MELFIKYALVAVSIILALLVVVQAKGTGLSIAPGSGDFGKFERRGAEKTIHTITIVVAILFTLLATLLFFVS